MRHKKILLLSLLVFSILLNYPLASAVEEEVVMGEPATGRPAEEKPVEKTVETQRAQIIPEISEVKDGKVSLDLRNIDLIDAIKFLSLKAGLNIIPTQKVSGRVTLTVENAPIKDVFEIMMRSNNLAYDKKGEIYNIMTEPEYRAIYGKNFFDVREVKIFRLKYAIPTQAFSLLDAIKSEIGRLLVDAESGTVLLLDTPDKIKEAQEALNAMEQQSNVKIFNLKYAKAKDIEETLKTQLDAKKIGYIKADDRTNQVIVQTLPDRMSGIEQLIAGLDKKTKAVLIDTKIIRITLTDQLDTGIQWEGLFQVASSRGVMSYIGSYPFSLIQSAAAAATATGWQSREKFYSSNEGMSKTIGAYPFSGTTTGFVGSKVTPGEKVHIGMVEGKRDFDVIIKYLQTFGKTKIMSNPTLSVVNNEEAKIHIGERRAYVTTTTTTGASTSTVAEEVTYVDIGVRLSITPMINEDGYVTMKVKPEISSVIGNVVTSENNLIPIIDTSTAETTVIAKDGATIILGGLGREEKVVSTEQIPFLGKLPLLGFLFSTKTQRTERTEMVIMLTPIIFEGDKLVTAKDKESEKFGVKKAKRFDVFKEEASPESIKVSLPPKEERGFITKGLKLYEGAKEKAPAAADLPGPLVVEEGRGFVIKGIKQYSSQGSKKAILSEGISKLPVSIKPEEAFKPKGFRPYD